MFLCSDRLDKYQSMGENGQAVHISALQLRETLRLRKQSAVADTLAIPQVNEQGDRIDWYAPAAGDVIPWSAATESERQAALSQLDNSHAVLRLLSTEYSQHSSPEQRLFGQLLEKALQFPDQNHVWLVGGKPIISFWGFVNARHPSRIDPLDCLRPPVPLAPAVAAAAAPVVAETLTERRVTRRGWWWTLPGWLRWLLPLLLLALLIMLLLRSCVPGFSIPGFSATLPDLPDAHLKLRTVNTGLYTPTGSADSGLLLNGSVNGANLPEASLPSATLPANDETPVNGEAPAEPALPDEAPAENAPPVEPAAPESAAETPTPDAAAGLTPPDVTPGSSPPGAKVPLTIPTDALAQGNTDFLNGRWRAGAGIQDQRTGKPLSLNYQINDGKGEVQMVRGDGVTCRGAVNAAIQSGNLAINNQGEAQCSDGSVYQMPDIQCAPGAQNIADCKGRYDANTLFPISMKQEASK
ncbi:SrfA family protein [Leclercia sp. H6W5]|uniref:SrfA family protein n=1 Tax=Leclercia tamurae TaxID=2926467 RepID=UPI0021CE0BCD|nr:SrfA family protein [Leclercia tamurae]MCU6680595.1 SrfA family protein [Leclercia tamurae]